MRCIEEIEMMRKGIVLDSNEEDESSIYTQPAIMPKKNTIRKPLP